jgi:AcrR family transcriptional regulator
MSVVSEPDRVDPAVPTTVEPNAAEPNAVEPSTIERIRHAALTSFAAHGTSATSLRAVAAAAGVSLGLVQHHFGTKANLIRAVDDHVFQLLNEITARPVSAPPADSVADMSSRVSILLSEHFDVVNYLGRALVDGSALGTKIFDTLAVSGTKRWNQRKANGELRDDVDLTWATINSMVLALGAIALRGHIERQVPGAFTDPDELARWENAVTGLLRSGLFREP